MRETFAILTVFFISSCGIYETKDNALQKRPDLTGLIGNPEVKVTYSLVLSQVFQNNCVNCHGPVKQKGGVRLDRYSDVTPIINQIKAETIITQTMPPSTPLTPDEQALIQKWIDQGALE